MKFSDWYIKEIIPNRTAMGYITSYYYGGMCFYSIGAKKLKFAFVATDGRRNETERISFNGYDFSYRCRFMIYKEVYVTNNPNDGAYCKIRGRRL